jgi:hypothetical protein
MRRQLFGAAGALVAAAVAVPLILWGQLRQARRVQQHMQTSQDAMTREWVLPEPGMTNNFYDNFYD